MTDDHLDLLDLDAHRAGEPLGAAARAHIAWCPTCQATLADLDAVASALKRAVPTADVPPTARPPSSPSPAIAPASQGARRGGGPLRRQPRAGQPPPSLSSPSARWSSFNGSASIGPSSPPLPPGAQSSPARRPTATATARSTCSTPSPWPARSIHGTPQVGDADRHDVDRILAMAVALDDVARRTRHDRARAAAPAGRPGDARGERHRLARPALSARRRVHRHAATNRSPPTSSR